MKRTLLSDCCPGWARCCGARRLAAMLLCGSTWLGAMASGCDGSGPRVYTAQRHTAEAGCLETYAPVGLVQAESLSALCAPVCLRLGEDLYVSAVCPPYPAEASVEPESSEGCAAALEAPACDEPAEDPDASAP